MQWQPRKVLVVGTGGAGQRHLRVLRDLGGDAVELIVCRTRGTTPVLDARMVPQPGTIEDAYGAVATASLDEALGHQPDLVVIATPSSMHATTAVRALEGGAHVIVEKPLALRVEDAHAVARAATATGRGCLVNFQRRHHPAWIETRRLLRDTLGTPRGALFHARSDVAAWHPYEPIDGLYAVRSDLGGGVLATECHELDLAVDLFGEPADVRAARVALRYEVDTVAEIALGFPGGEVVHVSLSLVDDSPGRGWTVLAENGLIRWDEGAAALTVTDRSGEVRRQTFAGFDNETLARCLHEWFSSKVASGTPDPELTRRLHDAVSVVEVVARATASGPRVSD